MLPVIEESKLDLVLLASLPNFGSLKFREWFCGEMGWRDEQFRIGMQIRDARRPLIQIVAEDPTALDVLYHRAENSLHIAVDQCLEPNPFYQPGPWTSEEAVLGWMSFDISQAKHLRAWAQLFGQYSPVLKELGERLILVDEAIRDGSIQEPVGRREFVEWAEREGFGVPRWMVKPKTILADETAAEKAQAKAEHLLARAKTAENELKSIKAEGAHQLPVIMLAALPARLGNKVGGFDVKKTLNYLENELMIPITSPTLKKYLELGLLRKKENEIRKSRKPKTAEWDEDQSA